MMSSLLIILNQALKDNSKYIIIDITINTKNRKFIIKKFKMKRKNKLLNKIIKKNNNLKLII